MFLPHFFVSSCPVDIFLIDYTGTRYGNQHQYICVSIAGIRWAGTIESLHLSHLVPLCLTIIPIVSRLYGFFQLFSYIAFLIYRPQVRLRLALRPTSRHAQRGAVCLSACPSRSPRRFARLVRLVALHRFSSLPESCVRIVWIAPSRIYILEHRLL